MSALCHDGCLAYAWALRALLLFVQSYTVKNLHLLAMHALAAAAVAGAADYTVQHSTRSSAAHAHVCSASSRCLFMLWHMLPGFVVLRPHRRQWCGSFCVSVSDWLSSCLLCRQASREQYIQLWEGRCRQGARKSASGSDGKGGRLGQQKAESSDKQHTCG